MDNFDLKKFLTENQLTPASRLSKTPNNYHQAVVELLKVIEANEATSSSSEEGNWRQDPTHILEIGIEILKKYGMQVPDGMFSDRLYDEVTSMAGWDTDQSGYDLPAIAEHILSLLRDPDMYQ
jgi:hypothetical protein